MKISRLFYLTALIGFTLFTSIDLYAMEVPIPEESIEYSLMGNPIHPDSRFSFLSALKMEYKEFNEEKYNAHCLSGIMANAQKNTSEAIEAFLEAARYRKIQAFKLLAVGYKQAGEYLNAYKWMVWAYQESILQNEKFTFPSNFLDETFKKEITNIGKKGKGMRNWNKISRHHKDRLSEWAKTINMCALTNLLEHRNHMNNAYMDYPSILEPYLTEEEFLAKKYLFRTTEQLKCLASKMVFGSTIELKDISRLLAAFVAKNDIPNIEWAAGTCLELPGYEKNTEVLFKKLIKFGSLEAHYQLGNIFKQQGKYQEGLPLIRHAAENNHANAQAELGYLFLHGIGTDKDLDQAFQWFREAHNGGCMLGTYNLGSCYFLGNGVEKNYKQAKFYYEQAAELGDSTAYNDLGVMYQSGKGVKKCQQTAGMYFKKSAEMKDPLGIAGYACYLYEEGNPLAFKMAEELLHQGGSCGHFELGLCYLNGLGVKQNRQKALALIMEGIKLEIKNKTHNLPMRILSVISKLHNQHIIGEEIQLLKNTLLELCKTPAEKVYYQGYFAYFDHDILTSFNFFNQAYLLGIEESAEMIEYILEVLHSLTNTETDSSEEALGNFCDETSSEDDVPSVCILDAKEKLKQELNLQDRKEHRKQTREISIKQSSEKKQNKEERLRNAEFKAKEKLERKIAELCSSNSSAPLHVGAEKEIHFVFDDSKAGEHVEKLFKEMMESEPKLSEMIDDIINNVKSNHVHPLTGPLKGYFARHINDFDRLVYRWVGPGKLEIRSCQGHYGD